MTESFSGVYSSYGVVTCIVAVVLLAALVIVLDLGFEQGQKALRKL